MRRAPAIAAAAVLTLRAATALAGGPPCRPDFISAPTYPMSYGTTALIATDVNGDGLPDLVLPTNYPAFGIGVALGKADGTFGPAIVSPVSDYILSAVVGNFTNDSNPDVVISGYGTDLELLVGNGDGTFQAPVSLGPVYLYSPIAVDVNADGKLDIVAASYWTPAVFVLIGDGNGGFAAPISTPLPAAILALAVGDVDGDGKPDLAATLSSRNSVSVLPGTGNGHFAQPIDVIAGFGLGPIALADMNGDGHLDIDVLLSDYAAVLLGNGDGTFQAAHDYPGVQSPTQLVVGDFDGDGKPDVGIADDAYGSLSRFLLLRNRGNGSLGPARDYLLATGGQYAAAADFGADGALDVASIGSAQDVTVLRNDGAGNFAAPRLALLTSAPSVSVSGDFNEDGIDDVVSGDQYLLVTLLGAPGGGLTHGPDIATACSDIYSAAAADFDADGHLDVAFSCDANPGVFIFLGNGDGSFRRGVLLPVPTSYYTRSVAVGDFDGNGTVDVAASDPGFSGSGSISIFLGRGDGLFDPASVSPADAAIRTLVAGDFNGDGLADLAAGAETPSPAGLSIFLSLGAGALAAPVTYATTLTPMALVAGNFRNSGHLDLVVGNPNATGLEFLQGQGDGTFGPPIAMGSPYRTAGLAAADFDANGTLDLLSAGQGDASFLYGNGDGSFSDPVVYALNAPTSALAGDFDGDGLLDAAFGEQGPYGGGVATLLNGGLSGRVSDASVLVGGAAVLQVRSGGFGALTYQWRRNGTPLSDGGPVSGSTTATLTIDPAAFTDAASYDVLVTDACGSIASSPGALFVEFADVPVDNPFHADIITVATDGITAGCGGADYCPASLVRRDQMAVFLLKSEHGSAYVPPDCTGLFTDVPCPGTFADWIEQLAAEGVTSGCGGNNYCPGNSVTRAQMAVFLLKTLLGSAYAPPPAIGLFADVPVGAFAADYVEDLYNRAITGGCSANPLLYCPGNPVNRAQMATFLVRTFLTP